MGTPWAETIVKVEKGKEKTYDIEEGFREVKLPGRREQLYLVVVTAAKRFFGVPVFHYYARADGISVLLTRRGRGRRKSPPVIPEGQRRQQLLFAEA